MKTRPPHKLSLGKTTLRTLSGQALRLAGGGTAVDILIASDSCDDTRLAVPLSEDCLRR